MGHARLQILSRFFGKHILVQMRYGAVDLLHDSAKIADERAAFAGKIVDTGLTCSVEISVWLQKFCRHAWRHGNADKPVTQQTRAADGEFAPFRNFHVIVNLQRDGNAVTFTNKTRTV